MSLTLPGLVLLACLTHPLGSDLVVEGVVFTPDGIPAAGARIVASTWKGFRHAEVLADGVIGEDGRFLVEVPESWIRRSDYRSLDLWVWREDLSLAQISYSTDDLPVGEEVTIHTRLPGAEEITVQDEVGQPLSDVRVTPTQYGNSTVPDILSEALTIRTGTDGKAVARAWDPEQVDSVAVETEQHGRQVIGGMEGWPDERVLHLDSAGRVRIEIEGEPPPLPPGVSLDVQTFRLTEDGRGVSRVGEVSLPLSGEGVTKVYPVAAGSANPRLFLPHALDRVPRISGGLVEAGELLTLPVEWIAGVRVIGRVVDAESKEGVPGVTLSIGNYPLEFPVVSGEDGRVEFRALPGHVSIRGVDAPSPHVGWKDLSSRTAVAIDSEAEVVELAEIEVSRSRGITGRIVDEQGRPVPGAWVYGSQSRSLQGGHIMTSRIGALADDEGFFRIGGSLGSEENVTLAARLGTARTRESAQFPVGAEVELVLVDNLLLPVGGTVLDRDGRPVVGATVTIWKGFERFPHQAEEEVVVEGRKQLLTDEEGIFEGGPCLDPSRTYSFVVDSSGTELFTSAWATGAELKDGVQLEVDCLVTIRGRLLDAEGEPRSGVTVRVTVDARNPVSTETDTEGRFELVGVHADGAIVLAEVEGLGIRGRWFDGGESCDWTITDDEAPLRAAPRPISREEELAIAARLAKSWLDHAIESGEESSVLRAMQCHARFDVAGALELLDEGVIAERWREAVLREAVSALAPLDPTEALIMVGEMELGMSSVLARLGVADALPDEARERKLEILGLALAEARRIETPAYRLVSIARIAEELFDLGEEELSRELLEDARTTAEDLPAEEWAGYARGSYAEELAVFDLEGALALVEPMPDRSARTRHYRNIAFELASRDPEAAEEVFAMDAESWYRSRGAPGICAQMASVDLERARRIADGADSAPKAYGEMARALTEERPAVARELLEVAFLRMEESGQKGRDTYARRNDSAVAGSFLPVAELVAPDRVREFLWRAVALRSRPADERSRPGSDRETLSADCALAFFVARYDRELARLLVMPAVALFRERSGELRDRGGNWRSLSAALVEIDPEWAAEFAEEFLTPRACGDMAHVLSREGEERIFYVMDRYLNMWIPGEDDLL
jgi:hypothetical protein